MDCDRTDLDRERFDCSRESFVKAEALVMTLARISG